MIIPIRNSSDAVLEVQLEPWLDTLSLAPGEAAELSGTFSADLEGVEIEYSSHAFLSIYVPAGSKLRKAR